MSDKTSQVSLHDKSLASLYVPCRARGALETSGVQDAGAMAAIPENLAFVTSVLDVACGSAQNVSKVCMSAAQPNLSLSLRFCPTVELSTS